MLLGCPWVPTARLSPAALRRPLGWIFILFGKRVSYLPVFLTPSFCAQQHRPCTAWGAGRKCRAPGDGPGSQLAQLAEQSCREGNARGSERCVSPLWREQTL